RNAKAWNSAPDEAAGIRDGRGRECKVADMHRGFGDAVHIDQERRAVGVVLVPGVELSELEGFAAKDHIAKGERSAGVGAIELRLHQLIKCGGRLIENGDVLTFNETQKLRW